MQNDKKNSNSRSRRVLSVEETTAAITAEQEREETANSLLQSDKSATFESSNQSSSSKNMEGSQDLSDDRSKDQSNKAAHSGQGKAFVPLLPPNCQETDDHAQKILDNLQRGRETRIQNHSLIIDDLKELGMFGELSGDHDYVTMPFEGVHRLVTTMRMANVILNEGVQARRRAKLQTERNQRSTRRKENCPNIPALLVELEKAKYELTLNHSFQSMGGFEGIACTLEGSALFETLLISRTMDWLASLSFNPDLEVRRGTLSVFSELRAAYSSQKTLHELHFHLHDDKKLLETRWRGAMADLGERLTKDKSCRRSHTAQFRSDKTSPTN
jgi:hypothetical protein